MPLGGWGRVFDAPERNPLGHPLRYCRRHPTSKRTHYVIMIQFVGVSLREMQFPLAEREDHHQELDGS
jgi:hypothetical protein